MTGFNSKRASARDKLTGTALIDRVLAQIEQDVGNKDFTAIEELLSLVPEKNLIALGDLSSLGKEIGEKRPFSKHELNKEDVDYDAMIAKLEEAEKLGWCNYYTRDRGEDAPFKVYKNLADACEHYQWSDYYYVFKYSKADDYQSGEWHFKKNGERWKKLAPAIKKLKQEECAE